MFKLNKITDYGVVILGHMAVNCNIMLNTHDLSLASSLPMPTVAKILKLLARAKIITSHRGANGGYLLIRDVDKINLAEIIYALDGPVALTACVDGVNGDCNVGSSCLVRGRWDKLNNTIKAAIEKVSLGDLINHDPVPDFIGSGDAMIKQTDIDDYIDV